MKIFFFFYLFMSWNNVNFSIRINITLNTFILNKIFFLNNNYNNSFLNHILIIFFLKFFFFYLGEVLIFPSKKYSAEIPSCGIFFLYSDHSVPGAWGWCLNFHGIFKQKILEISCGKTYLQYGVKGLASFQVNSNEFSKNFLVSMEPAIYVNPTEK